IFPSFDTPKSVKFRSHVALATLEGEHVMVVSHNSLDGTPSVLTTKTGAVAGDNGRWSSYELPDGFDWDLGGVFSRGLCFSECCDTPVPAQTKKGATDYGAGPLAFMLMANGDLQCAAMVHPQQPEVSLRRKTAP
ncbi:unnamed protein product, partial [Ectocarpus sp. 8 AP-2014]